ncbi:MAG TPA: protein kinase, partial [Gammaproteobacteria bacterium]|nr:protein kinase [Gammaproteobacteria bacterium]
MSPEQARGRFVDERTDVWALGCLLFEMLTGQPAFAGEDVMLTLARVLDRDTDLSSIPGTISPAVRHTIALCLQKDPDKRIADIRDVRLALDGAFDSEIVRPAVAAGNRSVRQRLAVPLAAGLVGVAITATAAWQLWPVQTSDAIVRFAIEIPEDQPLRNTVWGTVTASPDGRYVAYNTSQGLMLRDLSLLDSRLITGTEVPLGEPFFSYDSQSIAYRTNDGLVRISVVGGVPILIDETAVEITGASWESGDRIIFSRGRGLWQIPAGGGPYEQIIETNGLVSSPQLLPDGDTVIYSATAEFGGWNNGQVFAATLSTGETRVLIERGSAARYLPTGHLVYVLEGTLFGRAFDASTLSFSGGPVVLVEGITQAPFGSANYSIAQNGTLVYLADAESFNRNSLLWVDRQGRETPITTGGTTRLHLNPRLSPNGTQLAFTSFARDEPDNQDIWVYDLARGGTPTRITRSNVFDWRPVWTPDGESLIYTSFRDGGGLYRRSADGTGPEVQLSQHTMNTHIPESVSRDGTEMVLRVEPESIGSAGRDLYRLQLDSDATPEPL